MTETVAGREARGAEHKDLIAMMLSKTPPSGRPVDTGKVWRSLAALRAGKRLSGCAPHSRVVYLTPRPWAVAWVRRRSWRKRLGSAA